MRSRGNQSIWNRQISLGRKPKEKPRSRPELSPLAEWVEAMAPKVPEPKSARVPASPQESVAPLAGGRAAVPASPRPSVARPAQVSAPAAAAPAAPAEPLGEPVAPRPAPPATLDAQVPATTVVFASAGAEADDSGPPEATPAPAALTPEPARAPEPASTASLLTAPAAAGPRRLSDVTRKPEPRESGVKRHKALVGLKIGASQITAAHIHNNGVPRVVQVAQEPLAPGIVVGGELRQPDDLAHALKDFFAKHKLPRTPVRLGIANNRIGVRIIELEGIDDPKQLANAVRFRAQEVVPIPLEEAVLDYRVLREDLRDDGTRVHKVLLVVAHRDLVERYAGACRRAGLKLVGIDLEAFALLRAMASPGGHYGEGDDSALVVVSIGHDRSTLAVSNGTICEFTRVLEWGGSVLDAALAQALGVTAAEADAIRLSVSLDETSPAPAHVAAEVSAHARAAMRAEVHAFARDLLASLRFYQEQPGSLGIGEIVLTGGGALLDGLDSELTRLLGISVRLGDPLARARPNKKVAKEPVSISLTAAIGLGIDD